MLPYVDSPGGRPEAARFATVEVEAESEPEAKRLAVAEFDDVAAPERVEGHHWSNYVRGVASVLSEAGHRVAGLTAAVAGFGGCAVALVRAGAEEALREKVAREYPPRTGLTPRTYVFAPAPGARVEWT
jgi:galactokinase